MIIDAHCYAGTSGSGLFPTGRKRVTLPSRRWNFSQGPEPTLYSGSSDRKAARCMIDFSSALYLGMTHPASSLAPWDQLTTGCPTVLHTPKRNRHVEERLAVLTGCKQAVLGPSTFHLFWDLFDILAADRVCLYIDGSAYPIARWGAEHAKGKGVPVRFFPHHDAAFVRGQMERDKTGRRLPIVVTDGFCPGCGKFAPIAEYLDAIRSTGGLLVIDDTQALGIWGGHPDPANPYGKGGGGSLRLLKVNDPSIVLVSSLAKGFGAPLAMIGGSKNFIRRFKAESQTRVHCSPPSAADVSAAEHALAVNTMRGDMLRRKLGRLVHLFKRRLTDVPVSASRGLFPVQSLKTLYSGSVAGLYRSLRNQGVYTVLHRRCIDRTPHIGFLITVRHSEAEISRAGETVAEILNNSGFAEKTRRFSYAI
jgi:8-amino-7-oxononanoate synthase